MEWAAAFDQVLHLNVIFYLLAGAIIGTVVGALPGLSATMAIAILTPLTFWLAPNEGFAMLIGVWNSAIFAGGISAILVNTPGTPASIMQSLDGYKLYTKGQGGLALGINVIYSVFGGVFSTLMLMFFSFPIARFAIKFGPTEYFAVALLGMSMMIAVSEKSVIKGLIVGLAGVLVSTIGLDPILAVKRFTFGSTDLIAGVTFLPVMIGMFGIGEVLNQIYERDREVEAIEEAQKKQNLKLGRVLPTKNQFISLIRPSVIAGAVGSFIGAIPAAGGDIASIIVWGQSKKMSKHPEEYGEGSVEGLAVASTANNAVLGGALTTMLTLGIPGDAVSAILIGSLMMYGMQPGPKMFTENSSFVATIILLMLLANVVILFLGLATAKASAKVLNVKKETVWVAVTLFCIVGAFSLNNSVFDVMIMLVAGILGFLFKRGGFVPGPFILGLLLGNLLESNMRRALVMSRGSYAIFFTRPITLVIFIFITISLVYPSVKRQLSKRRKAV